MPDAPESGGPRPFDAPMIEHLVGLMAKHDLSEIDLHEGGHRIRLRRGATLVAAPAPVMTAAAAPAPTATAPAATPAAPSAPAKKLHDIKSPMVGTFYAKPGPDKDDYVKVGAKVKPETVVCKLEAMKIFNELTADVAGTVAEVCVTNGSPVDFDTVLFRVEPS